MTQNKPSDAVPTVHTMDESSAALQPTPDPRWQLFTSSSGFVLLALGILYALGATLTAAQFSHAGLPVTESFSLFPIQTLLARGVATLAVHGVYILSVFLLLAALTTLTQHLGIGSKDSRLDRFFDERRTNIALPIIRVVKNVSFFSMFSIPFFDYSFPLSIFITAAGLVWIVTWNRQKDWTVPKALAVYWVLGSIAFVLSVLVSPPPLASVQINTETGSIRGQLVYADASAWYLAKPNGVLIAIPDRLIQSASVRKAKSTNLTIGQMIRDHL